MNVVVQIWLITSLVISSCYQADAELPQVSPQTGQEIFCERSYTNFAWGFQHTGIYVDAAGRLYSYTYKGGDNPWSPRQADAPTRQELEQKYSPGRRLIRQIDAQELREKFSLVAPASRGRMSKRVQRGADQGSTVCRCYLREADTDRYREVELKVEGDWNYENLAPEARALTRWLESLSNP